MLSTVDNQGFKIDGWKLTAWFLRRMGINLGMCSAILQPVPDGPEKGQIVVNSIKQNSGKLSRVAP
jgi:hypothetical protein